MSSAEQPADQAVGPAVPGWSPRQVPEPELLVGRTCRLERLSRAHADDLFDALVLSAPTSLWTYLAWGPFTERTAFDDWLDAVLADPTWRQVAIVVDGRALGIAGYLRIEPAGGSVEVGGVVFGPALQRTTAATEAMGLMAGYVFGLGYRRYEWKCDALNARSRAAAVRLGFSPEGVWRQATVYKGRNRDTAWFAMTDADWARLAPVHEHWVAASSAGGQPWSLGVETARVLASLRQRASEEPHR